MSGRPFSGHVCGGYLFLLPGLLRTNHSILFCPRCNGVRRRGLSSALYVSCTGRVEVCGAVLVLDDGGLYRRGSGEGRGAHVRGLAGSRPARLVVLVTIDVVRDTPHDCHFSAWSRPKPAPDPLPGPSVASGVIPTKGGRNGPVPATPGRAPQGRWRSSPWKRCNHAPPRSRVREHPAPLGALRRVVSSVVGELVLGQGAPRTARCIKTRPRGHEGRALVPLVGVVLVCCCSACGSQGLSAGSLLPMRSGRSSWRTNGARRCVLMRVKSRAVLLRVPDQARPRTSTSGPVETRPGRGQEEHR